MKQEVREHIKVAAQEVARTGGLIDLTDDGTALDEFLIVNEIDYKADTTEKTLLVENIIREALNEQA